MGFGFYGGLTSLSTDTMYAMHLAGSGTLLVSGAPVALPKAVTLMEGWTFLPCPHQASKPLAAGLPAFDYQPGDQVKSHFLFAEFYEYYGWCTSLLFHPLDPCSFQRPATPLYPAPCPLHENSAESSSARRNKCGVN